MPAERVPLDVHLDAMTSGERVLWDRYVELVEAAGDSELISTKSGFGFRAPYRQFTGGFFRSRRLELWFDLPKPVPEAERDDRFREVWQMPHAWVHRLKIERPDQLDGSVGRWLAEAWAFFSKPAAER
jgi:hypothetical protein